MVLGCDNPAQAPDVTGSKTAPNPVFFLSLAGKLDHFRLLNIHSTHHSNEKKKSLKTEFVWKDSAVKHTFRPGN